MRYFVVTYVKRPSGQMDEQVVLERNLKARHYQMANVILDFKNKSIVQCSLQGTVVPKDWQRIRDFYHQHYSKVIDQLEAIYNETEKNNPN
jgi:hypothetical protein